MDWILNITAKVDGVLTGAQKARTALNGLAENVLTNSKRMQDNLRTNIEQTQKNIRFLQGLKPNPAQKQAIAAMRRDIEVMTTRLRGLEDAEKAVLKANVALFEKVQARTRAMLQEMVNMGSMMRQIGSTMRNVGIAFTAGAAAITAGFVSMASTGLEFSQTMDTVVSVVGDLQGTTAEAAENYETLNSKVRELGRTTNFTSSQVADAARVLGQAGFTSKEIVDALTSTVDLARSGYLEMGEAARFAADMVNAFNLQASENARVTDALAAAQANSNTTIQELGNAFSFAASMSAALGQSVEDTATGIALLANAGIKSSRAGTGFSQVLSGLIRNIDKTNAVLGKYGKSFEDVNPRIKGVIDIIEEFMQAGVSAADIIRLFGIRAGRA